MSEMRSTGGDRGRRTTSDQDGPAASSDPNERAVSNGQRTVSHGQNESAVRSETVPDSSALVATVFRREVRTLARTRSYLLLVVVLTGILLGTTWLGGGMRAGYVAAVVDLQTPLELLVPAIAFAFGYRAITDDSRRGELDVLGTYPIAPGHVVAGVFLGRALGVLVATTVPLAVVAFGVVSTDPNVIPVYATHAGADSPVLYARFVVLTVAFAVAMLAVAIAISALASAARTAIAMAVVALVVLLVGADIALVAGFSSGLVGEESLVYSLAFSPLSAYRGLVLETAVVVASGVGPRAADPVASMLGLTVWTIASLAVARMAVRRRM